MQTDNRFFDDLARMANGALNTLSGLREEIETRVRERVERMLSDMDLVTREEFDAAREMAQKARAEQETLAARLAAVEQRLGEGGAAGTGRTSRGRQSGAAKSGAGSRSTRSGSARSTTKRGASKGQGGAASGADDQGPASG